MTDATIIILAVMAALVFGTIVVIGIERRL